jgi:hypothetical protein
MDRLAAQWTATTVIGLNGITESPESATAFVVNSRRS